MKTIAEWNHVKVPTWALSYLINADSSGLKEDEIQAVDKWWKVWTDKCQNMNGHSVIISIETYFEDWMEQKRIVKDLIDDIEDVNDLRQLKDAVGLLEHLTKIKNEYQESYFSWSPQIISLRADVQDCTIVILGE